MTNTDLQLIKTFTSTVEKRDTAGKFGYQKDTVSAIIRGDRRITDDNKAMMAALLRLAKKNSKKQPSK
ncbi:hypothetical protein [Chryseobacterium viscerum]|uniref:XRE family transcriptional regulator n=1 Tax=Chryseobacterium viscerum TaxID=1037377 RepID=A0A5N4BJ62_9FLAO|nr:hypothetical protein [Chryseobacterium viscerum]KAB1228480.1 hypothetical protein F8D52_22670 [Chryseobacterium viscerum]